MIKVAWTHRAKERLREIRTKIALDQPVNADRFLGRIIERGESLAEQSLRGRMVPEFQNPNIREVFEGDYRIIYLKNDGKVSILTVRGFAELLPNDPKTL